MEEIQSSFQVQLEYNNEKKIAIISNVVIIINDQNANF